MDNHPANVKTWLIGCFFLFTIQSNGQNCELPIGFECTTLAGNFKLITTFKTFSQMVADGELLPQATSSTAPQFLIVCQTITDNLPGSYEFASGSEIVFLNNNSGIVVNGGASLHFRNTFLHGCEKLWDRVLVKGGGLLELSQGCRVEDAYIAVDLEPSSVFISLSTNFDGNYTCIYAGDSNTSAQHSITTTIAGTIFSGQKALIENYVLNPVSLPNCYFSKPMFGIVAQNVSQMTVGLFGGGDANLFQNFNESWSCPSVFVIAAPAGIIAENSSMWVINSAFRNIANGQGGTGISFLTYPGKARVLNVTGLGKRGTPTFDNVQTGVVGLGNIQIQDCRFNNLERGIFLSGNPAPYRVIIRNNAFENVYEHSVFADQISPIRSLDMYGNAFNDNSLNSGASTGFLRSGIFIHSFTPGQQNSWLFDNTFLNAPKTGLFNFGNRGIGINNLNGSLIEQNVFNDNFGSTTNPYLGITLNKSSAGIWSNTFGGAGNWSTHPSTAIQILESPECWLNCNYADQTRLGWDFQGMNCDGATLERNDLNSHDISLLLRKDAIIGNQNNKYNRWIGAGSNVEVKFDGRNPGVSADVSFVQQSRFRIHTPNMTTDYWPDPRLIGTTNDPGIWFGNGAEAGTQCFSTLYNYGNRTSSITEADSRVLDGSFQPVGGHEAGVWEAKLRLFGRLAENPELRTGGSAAATWYSAQQNTSLSSLGDAYQQILALSRFSVQEQSDLDATASAHEDLVQDVTDKDAQIAAAIANPPLLEQLLAERQQLELALAAAIVARGTVLTNLRNARLAEAQQVLAQLNAATTTEPYETDFQTVCRILLETYLSENPVTEANRQTLTGIAQQCRYEGGFAVIQARASLGGDTDWSAYDNCPDTPAQRNAGLAYALQVSLAPNPAQGAALLNLGRLVVSGRAVLRDLNGRALQEWQLDGKRQLWLRWDQHLPAGMYLLELFADQTVPQVLKLAIEHH